MTQGRNSSRYSNCEKALSSAVFSKAAEISRNERQLAADAIRDCDYSSLRRLEFLLDLAVPQQAIDDLLVAESDA